MSCMLSCYEAETVRGSVPGTEVLPAAMDQQVRNRQAAALYLHAAAKVDNAAAREFLRRRAATLISCGLGDRGQRLAC